MQLVSFLPSDVTIQTIFKHDFKGHYGIDNPKFETLVPREKRFMFLSNCTITVCGYAGNLNHA
jgi:hypothetical protein